MTKFTPKLIYVFLLLLVTGGAVADHLTSQSMPDLGSPSELGNACAPCGAPCTE